jgi:hypothetical protein
MEETMALNSARILAAIRSWRPLAILALLALTLFTPADQAIATDSYTVGAPTRNGRITLTMTVTKNGVSRDVKVTTPVDSTWTVLDKQLAILYASNPAKADTLIMHGYTIDGKITFEGQHGWKVDSVVVTEDSSCEPHKISLGVPLPSQEALCSLSGVASGADLHGQSGAGTVRLTVQGQDIVVPTQPGMPSEIIEQMMISRLNQVGIAARFATANDFSGGYETLPHDARVIWFPVPDTTGFGQETNDSGLSLDLLGIINGALNTPSAAPIDPNEPGLSMNINPNIFTNDHILIRYATRTGGGPVHIDLFDVAGRRVRTLLTGGALGSGTIIWDGCDERRVPLCRGIYFVRLTAPEGSLVRRVVRVRD